jgi:hypothetical protein
MPRPRIATFPLSLLLAIVLAPDVPTAKPTNVVLVDTVCTRVDSGRTPRTAVEIQNRGTASIFCAIGECTGLDVDAGRELSSGETWVVQAAGNVPIYCIAAATQTTGYGTTVTEF